MKPTHQSNHLTIGLLWHSISSDNLGVGALTLSQMALISRAAESLNKTVSFIIIGTRGTTPYEISGFQVDHVSEFALRAFKSGDFRAISLMSKCDAIFDIGEGDSFADIYGIKRLTMQTASKVLARTLSSLLILSPQTIGPFQTKAGKLLGRIGMKSANLIVARDQLSSKYVSEMGFDQKLQEVIDVAFALPYCKREKKEPELIEVGINVSGLMFNDGKSFGLSLDYKNSIESIIKFFQKQPNVEVTLVPHVISDSHEFEDDLRASIKINSSFPGVKMAPRFKNPSEAKSYISGFDFFIGARMHACIAAISSGVAVIPMAYSRKFNGLFNTIEYPYVLDCLKENDDSALSMIERLWLDRELLSTQSKISHKKAIEKIDSYTSSISKILGSIQ